MFGRRFATLKKNNNLLFYCIQGLMTSYQGFQAAEDDRNVENYMDVSYVDES